VAKVVPSRHRQEPLGAQDGITARIKCSCSLLSVVSNIEQSVLALYCRCGLFALKVLFPDRVSKLSTGSMQTCSFSDKYLQSAEIDQRLLGHGGSSAGVERYVTNARNILFHASPVFPAWWQRACMTKHAYARRCFSAATGEPFAVKRLSPYQEEHFLYLLDNEIRGLAFANSCNSRIKTIMEEKHCPSPNNQQPV